MQIPLVYIDTVVKLITYHKLFRLLKYVKVVMFENPVTAVLTSCIPLEELQLVAAQLLDLLEMKTKSVRH
jgi:hypothetical protein